MFFDNFATLDMVTEETCPCFKCFVYIRSQFREKNTEIPIEKFRSHVLSSNTMTVAICPAAARQSEIFTEFPLKDSFNLLDSIGCFLRNVERFQKLCSFAR